MRSFPFGLASGSREAPVGAHSGVRSRGTEPRRWAALAAVIALCCCDLRANGIGGVQPGAGSATPDARRDMIAALHASGPHPSLGDAARTFDRFVGTWDCDFVTFTADGVATRFPGQVLFGWIIDGRALQDIWIAYPPRIPKAERTIGTSVRFFDTKTGMWRVTWIAPSAGSVIVLAGRAVGERIILNGKDTDGSLLRWSFNDITPGSFIWRGENSRDGGKTWWLQEEHHMRRHIAPLAAPKEERQGVSGAEGGRYIALRKVV